MGVGVCAFAAVPPFNFVFFWAVKLHFYGALLVVFAWIPEVKKFAAKTTRPPVKHRRISDILDVGGHELLVNRRTMRLITEVEPRRLHIVERKTTDESDDDGCRRRRHQVSFEIPTMPARFTRIVAPKPSIDVLLLFLLLLSLSGASETSNDVGGSHLDAKSSSGQADDIDERVLKQWGLPDTTAQVGKLFRYHIPTDAFTGKVHHYEASETSSSGHESLPGWLQFNGSSSTLEGVPTSQDLGQVYLTIKAFGHPDASHGNSEPAQDVFSLDVLPYVRDSEPTFLFKDAELSLIHI